MSDISRQKVKAGSKVLKPGHPRSCTAHSALSGRLEEAPGKQTDRGLRHGGPRGSFLLLESHRSHP